MTNNAFPISINYLKRQHISSGHHSSTLVEKLESLAFVIGVDKGLDTKKKEKKSSIREYEQLNHADNMCHV